MFNFVQLIRGCVFNFKLSARSQMIKSLYDFKRTEFVWIPIDRKKPPYFKTTSEQAEGMI